MCLVMFDILAEYQLFRLMLHGQSLDISFFEIIAKFAYLVQWLNCVIDQLLLIPIEARNQVVD